jgi:hypothetical protein
MTELEILRIRFLDWLHGYEPEVPGDPATVGHFFGGEGYPPEVTVQVRV